MYNGFWHIYRLIVAKKWLLLLLFAATGAIIFLAMTLQANRSETLTEAKLGIDRESVAAAPATAAADPNRSINDVVNQMTRNSQVIDDAARLLKLDEKARAKEFKRILEQTGAFATADADAKEAIDKKIALGELRESRRQSELNNLKLKSRAETVRRLAEARDKGGSFAPGGVPESPEAVVERIRKEIKVEAVPSLDSVETNIKFTNSVRVLGKFPREAEANLYVNTFCLAFMDYYRRVTNNSSNKSIEALETQLLSYESDLRDARRLEMRIKRATPDVNTTEGVQAATLSAENRVQSLRETFDGAIASVNTLTEELAATRPTNVVNLPSGEKTGVQSLEAEVTKAFTEYQRLKATSNVDENNPFDTTVASARQAYESLNRALEEARQRPNTRTELNPLFLTLKGKLADARDDANRARAQLAQAERSLRELKQRQTVLPGASGALDDVREEIKRNQEYIRTTKDKITTARSAQLGSARAGSISFISSAVPQPSDDTAARRAKLAVFGGLLALLAGIAAIVMLDAVDNSIRDTRDVEQLMELPIAGVIPAQIPDPARAPRIAYLDPLSPVAEAYRLLRTDVLFTRHDHPFQSLLGVGVKPGQGTTTTVSNLAITLAQSGKKVILVDGDLRRPRLHEAFKLSNERGLTSVLNAQCVLEDALQPTDVANLMLLPAGPQTTQPSELLGSEEMRDLHATLREAADFVLFDSPSAITFADAAILASFIDATLIVIRANEVPRKAEQDVRALLDRARANIIGVVLNGMAPERVDNVHYHGHYYPTDKGGKKNNVPQLPSGGGGTRSLPGGGSGNSAGSRDVWDDEDEDFEVEPLRPAARQSASAPAPMPEPAPTVAPEPVATEEESLWDDESTPVEKPNPARRWKGLFGKKKPVATILEEEIVDEYPAFDATYVAAREAEATAASSVFGDDVAEEVEATPGASVPPIAPLWQRDSTIPVFEITPEPEFDAEAAFSLSGPAESPVPEPEAFVATEQKLAPPEKSFQSAVDMTWLQDVEELRQQLADGPDMMPGAEPLKKKKGLGKLFSRRV